MVRTSLGGCILLLTSSGVLAGYAGGLQDLAGNRTEYKNNKVKEHLRLHTHVELKQSKGLAENSFTSPGASSLATYGSSDFLDPKTALRGIYTECVFRLDYACLQRKAFRFVERLGRADRYPLLPFFSVVRTTSEIRRTAEESELANPNLLEGLVDQEVDLFFDEHVFRLELPRWMRDLWLRDGGARSSKNHVDFYFGDYIEDRRNMDNETMGRSTDPKERMMMCDSGCSSKKGGKMKMKGMKKCMMMMCMMVAGKSMLMMPLMMGLVKLMALKAMMMAGGAAIMMKGMMMKSFMKGKGGGMMMMGPWKGMGGGGGGGGWSDGGGGGGGGGWDSSGGGGGGWQSGGGGGGGGGGGYDRRDLPYTRYIPNEAAD